MNVIHLRDPLLDLLGTDLCEIGIAIEIAMPHTDEGLVAPGSHEQVTRRSTENRILVATESLHRECVIVRRRAIDDEVRIAGERFALMLAEALVLETQIVCPRARSIERELGADVELIARERVAHACADDRVALP